MRITPCDKYLLLKRYKKPQKQGALIITNEKEHHNWGIVVGCGNCNLNWDDCTDAIVQIKPYSHIPVDGSDDYFLLKEEDVIAFIEPELEQV